MSGSRWYSLGVLGAVLAIVTCVVSANAQLPLSYSQMITFGMFGVTTNQIARLNVVNAAVFSNPQISCSAELSFLDAQGSVLKSATFSIASGKAVYLDVERSEIDSSQGRLQIRALVSTSINSAFPEQVAQPVCSFVPTVEVFDKDGIGKTTIMLSQGTFVIVPIPLAAPPTPNGQPPNG